LNMGELSYATSVFPLGVPRGAITEVSVDGYNLGPEERKVKVDASKVTDSVERLYIAPQAELAQAQSAQAKPAQAQPEQVKPRQANRGEPFNRLRVVTGLYPEVFSASENNSLQAAQTVSLPVTINGRLVGTKPGSAAAVAYFKFTAKRGQQLAFNVYAD